MVKLIKQNITIHIINNVPKTGLLDTYLFLKNLLDSSHNSLHIEKSSLEVNSYLKLLNKRLQTQGGKL